ncbi:tRNA:m(4)X modification enzyme TRM13 homolog [Eumeta japonica]|uniref:tRNA:m(4)X modification enzyme TRM13 n=1 Tax=Eumeta variegata TaxID=151549 RepID=A0A4C1ZA74_EUMVA|nr:tRNA:m(4)X modification enzyme TRM13 homolog [Eumeta japonica]
MSARLESIYCAEHEPQDSSVDDKRIPCPLDPKHTCYLNKLEKHLLVCNARAVTTAAYVRRGVNAGTSPGAAARRTPLTAAPPDQLAATLAKIDKLYALVTQSGISQWNDNEKAHPCVAQELMRDDLGPAALRQLRQVSALLQLAEREGMIQNHTCYAELGAGRGRLAYYAANAWCTSTTHSRLLLVDRAAPRHKRDNKLPPGHATRLRADLADLLLDEAAATANVDCSARVVALAKHLCGAATDYALRCVTGARAARGLLIATCCHHRCDIASLAGSERLREHGLQSHELDLMLGVVSWATCGDGRPRTARADDADAESTRAARAEAGRRAKAILDWVRVEFLRANGWNARLVYFVPPDVTPENVCIVAVRDDSPSDTTS